MAEKPIPTMLVIKAQQYLGTSGLDFLREAKNSGKGWHPNHGTQITGFMKSSGDCQGWTDQDYLDSWVALVELCIK
jgi:hypothetical protein